MSGALVASIGQALLAPSTRELRTVLSRTLHRSIVDLERAPCAYGSSWWLEEITLRLDDRSRITLIFKNLVREAEGSRAGRVKPAFVTDPTREPWVYRMLLSEAPAGPPRLWAALTDLVAARHWLFIERVTGVPLTQVGNFDAWCAAARWLGRFHATAHVPNDIRSPLLRHHREYHQRWLARALSAAQMDAQKLARLRALVPAHVRATEVALATQPSLIHGEFYASNVLVEECGATYAIHPVDWEMAALGPPQLDLAALMSGWEWNDCRAMASAYLDGARAAGARCPTLDELLHGVTACRVLLAVQWLGWATGWTAPAGHRNNWLQEAEQCAKELRL